MNMSAPGPNIQPPRPAAKQQRYTSLPPRISHLLVVLPSLIVVFFLSIALIICQQESISILTAHQDAIEFNLVQLRSDSDFGTNPEITFDVQPSSFLDWTSIAIPILTIVAALGFWELRSDGVMGEERRGKGWAWMNLLVTIGNLILLVACTVVAFLEQKDDRKVRLDALMAGDRISWTRESLLCEMKRAGENNAWANGGCGFAMTGRWILVPLIMFSLVLVGFCFWQIGERGGVKWLFGKTIKSKSQWMELRSP